ncbi:MAG: hypothetical protein FJW30_17710 [Acidobacteria bacterium]|nr:hypothetical protein [Acidobacteriota bacterium]
MSIRNVIEQLSDACVTFWLGQDGALRVDSAAPEEIKALARENKQALVDLCRAQDFANAAGLRLVSMPQGGRGVAHPPGVDLDQVRWALGVLHLSHLPLFLNEDDCRWISYDEWRRRQPLWRDDERRQPAVPVAPNRRRRGRR